MKYRIKQYLKLLRANQWLKNVFILAPILFSFQKPDLPEIINILCATIGFSLIASSIYIINDWKDIESDKLHPKKRCRPLASESISKKEALILCLLCISGTFFIYIFIVQNTIAILLLTLYFLLNIAYCFKLKQIAIIDITIVASGFVIRLLIGSVTTGIPLSQWIILLTFLLALLLVVGKRRHDISIFEESGNRMRKSLNGYNLEFLNAIIIIIISSIIICYIMYTISPEVIVRNGKLLYFTSIFVVLGLFRYLQVLFVKKKGDSPTELLMTDQFLQINIVLWLISFIILSLTKNLYNDAF